MKTTSTEALAHETLRFSLGGTEYEIDLNARNAAVFRQQLAPFTAHARKATPSQRAALTASPPGPGR